MAFFWILLLLLGWRRDGRTGRHTRPRRTPQDPIPSLWCRQGSPESPAGLPQTRGQQYRNGVLGLRDGCGSPPQVTTGQPSRPQCPQGVCGGREWPGGPGMSPPGGLRGRRGSILGTAVQLGRRGYDSGLFLRALGYFSESWTL